jgi:hypothetical protein
MSDPREQLKSMLQDLINDRPEQAEVTIHNYIVAKTQQLAGLATAAPVEPSAPVVDDGTPPQE